SDRSRAVDARAVLFVAADEALVPRRLQGAVRGVRHEPESRDVRLQTRLGRSAARGAQTIQSREIREITMPNPKRRHSKTRTAKRRTHDALKAVGLGECPHCHEPKPPHRVCSNCGYYRGRQARAVDED